MSHPGATLGDVGGVERFTVAARALGDATRAAGLAVPAFRSPPRLPGATRTLRRYPAGAVVAVRLRDRPIEAVVADMVEGVVVANRLTGDGALRARTLLTAAVADALHAHGIRAPAARTGPGGLPSEQARVVERQTRAA